MITKPSISFPKKRREGGGKNILAYERREWESNTCRKEINIKNE